MTRVAKEEKNPLRLTELGQSSSVSDEQGNSGVAFSGRFNAPIVKPYDTLQMLNLCVHNDAFFSI